MPKFKDLTGQRFGKLTVLRRAEESVKHGEYATWLCRCDCGNEKITSSTGLIEGRVKSCGCIGNGCLKDLTRQRFGRLTVIERAENSTENQAQWLCKCDCGNTKIVSSRSLLKGNCNSCGCLRREQASKANRKHGMSQTTLYRNWASMKRRCFDLNDRSYSRYGGRGITICDEWRNDFQAFYDYVSTLEHFGEKGYSLDRIDNDGNYEPGNVRWSDWKTQSNNRSPRYSRSRLVKYKDEIMTLEQACKMCEIEFI